MRTWTYPDGSSLNITSSGAVTGPDQVGGQYYGTSYNYVRLNGGPWHPTGQYARSLHSAWTLAGAALTAAEAFEAITREEKAG